MRTRDSVTTRPRASRATTCRRTFAAASTGNSRTRVTRGASSFDCFGAGQRVTQELFGGANWSQSPEIAAQMFDSYERLRPLHELMAMVTLALDRVSDGDQRRVLQELVAELDLRCDQDLVDSVRLRREVVQRLRQLV